MEPPGLFRGRGDHPRMGMIKKRIYPRDIVINIGKGEPIPEHPYPGQTWKEVGGQSIHNCTKLGISAAWMLELIVKTGYLELVFSGYKYYENEMQLA